MIIGWWLPEILAKDMQRKRDRLHVTFTISLFSHEAQSIWINLIFMVDMISFTMFTQW